MGAVPKGTGREHAQEAVPHGLHASTWQPVRRPGRRHDQRRPDCRTRGRPCRPGTPRGRRGGATREAGLGSTAHRPAASSQTALRGPTLGRAPLPRVALVVARPRTPRRSPHPRSAPERGWRAEPGPASYGSRGSPTSPGSAAGRAPVAGRSGRRLPCGCVSRPLTRPAVGAASPPPAARRPAKGLPAADRPGRGGRPPRPRRAPAPHCPFGHVSYARKASRKCPDASCSRAGPGQSSAHARARAP
jgi:hypothetical protein